MPRTVKHKFPNHAWELNPLLVFFGRGQVCHATNLYGQEDNKSQNGPEKKLACRNLAEVFAWTYSNQNVFVYIASSIITYIWLAGLVKIRKPNLVSHPHISLIFGKPYHLVIRKKKQRITVIHSQPSWISDIQPTTFRVLQQGRKKSTHFFIATWGRSVIPSFFPCDVGVVDC